MLQHSILLKGVAWSFLPALFVQLHSAPVMWTKTTLMLSLYLENFHKIMATVLPSSLEVVAFLSSFSFFIQVKCKSYSFLWRFLLLWWIWVSVIRVWFAFNFTVIISLKSTLFKPVRIWKTHQCSLVRSFFVPFSTDN